MNNNDQYKIEELKKSDIKPLLKDGFSLLFRTPLLSAFSGIVMTLLLFSAFLLSASGLMYIPLVIIIPFFSYIFCKANDNSTPFWKLDFRYFKFIPPQYILFVVIFTVVTFFIGFMESSVEEVVADENSQTQQIMEHLAVVIIPFLTAILSSYILVSCNFTSMISYHCAEKWQLLNLNIKEDIKALSSFHLIIDDGINKTRLLLSFIGFSFYFVFYLLVFIFKLDLFFIITGLILTTLFLHHFLYVVIKHICGDGGINDKVKEKVFKFSESM